MINSNQKRYIEIGSKIKKLREEKGIPQQELATKVGFQSPTAISLIESGMRKVSIDDLEKIASVFDTTTSFFLGEDTLKPDIKVALRADKDLTENDRDKVLEFYKFVKSKKE
jgi:transcriptional regulator with XRE-family HTH domain